MNIREIAKRTLFSKKCYNCSYLRMVCGKRYCEYFEDFWNRDYEEMCEPHSPSYKAYELYLQLKIKGITNIDFSIDGNDLAYIDGFGYRDVITKDNIDLKLSSIDEEYKKWYSRWVSAYLDELEDNKYTNGGYRK